MPESATEPRTWEQIRADAIQAVRESVMAARDWDAEDVTDAVLSVVDEEALNRLGAEYVEASRLRSIRAEDGRAVMEAIPAREAVAGWVLAARGMLDGTGAENYTETSMEFPDRARDERYVFILQRVAPGKLTPHEARKQAEAKLTALTEAVSALAAEWEATAKEIGDSIEYADTAGAVAGFKMIGHVNHAKALRNLLAEVRGDA